MPQSTGSWIIDPGLLRAMRQDHADSALAAGDFHRSLAEADEILAASPDDPHALWTTARAALSLGDACMADVTLDRLVELAQQDGRTGEASEVELADLWAHKSASRFLLADFPGARAAAARALSLERDHAPAWVQLGLAQARLGDDAEAARSYAHAEALHPGATPVLGPSPSEAELQRVIEGAVSELASNVRALVEVLPIRVAWWPDPDVLRAESPPISPLVGVLFEKPPPADDTVAGTLESLAAAIDPELPTPTALWLFLGNLLGGAPEEPELIARLAESLTAEAAHWIDAPA